jgi:hypothetical protein
MKERHFLQNGKWATVWEICELGASNRDDTVAAGTSDPGESYLSAHNVAPEQVKAFKDAGWVFHERIPAERAARTSQARVYVKEGGRLVLGTKMLIAQFPENPGEDEVNGLLAPFGCHVARRLSFAPGLFEVAVEEEDADGVEVAERLSKSGWVNFAEPELIEPLGGRSSRKPYA